MEIENLVLEGTPDKIAEDVFKKIIGPLIDGMSAEDAESAKIFGFSIVWLAMAQYANQFPTNGAEKSLIFTVEKLIVELKKVRGEK